MVINETEYPYHDLTIDAATGQIAEAYEMFRAFHSQYYKATASASAVGRNEYQSKYPVYIFDCTKREAPTLGKAVDTRFHITTKATTTAYALILTSKRTYEYILVTGTVRRVPV